MHKVRGQWDSQGAQSMPVFGMYMYGCAFVDAVILDTNTFIT